MARLCEEMERAIETGKAKGAVEHTQGCDRCVAAIRADMATMDRPIMTRLAASLTDWRLRPEPPDEPSSPSLRAPTRPGVAR